MKRRPAVNTIGLQKFPVTTGARVFIDFLMTMCGHFSLKPSYV